MIIEFSTIVALGFAIIFITAILKGARVVPQRSAFVIERLGKYSRTLDAGFHVLIPFLDSIVARHSLKEQVIDVPSQMCITRDNIAIEIDVGVGGDEFFVGVHGVSLRRSEAAARAAGRSDRRGRP